METPQPAWPTAPGGRAPRAALRRALLAALIATLAIEIPLVAGYAHVQANAWREMTQRGLVPSAEYYGFLPLQGPRLVAMSLFSVDIGMWVALLTLLPLEGRLPGVFAQARRRLRRRWLLAHAPLAPLAAVLGGTRLFGEAMHESGAGATWFVPPLLSVPGTPAATLWVQVEQLVLFALSAAMLVHLTLLAGVVRPGRWLRNTALLAAGACALALGSWLFVMPAADRGLSRSMRQALANSRDACPGVGGLSSVARGALLFHVFARTSADAPALRERPPYAFPLEVSLPPPLPYPLAAGVGVVLDPADRGPGGGELAGGYELRVDGDGGEAAFPLPAECGQLRVVKIDRMRRWKEVAPLLAGLGRGPLRFGYRAAPRGVPFLPPGGTESPRLVLGQSAADLPPAVPRARVPLPFARPLAPGRPLPDEERGQWPRLGWRLLPEDREQPLDVVWREALPAAQPPGLGPDGDVALVIPDGAAWDDVLRAIAAASTAGARRIYALSSAPPIEAASAARRER